jgi:hypothetical protein
MTRRISDSIRHNRMVSQITDIGNAALFQAYDGAPTATKGGAITTQNKLYQATLGSPFGTDTNGTTTVTLPADVAALLSGTVAWYRIMKSDGTTFIEDGTITGTGGGGDVTVNDTGFISGVGVTWTSPWTIADGNA